MCLSRSRSTPCCRHNQTDPLPGPFPLMRIDKASTAAFMASPKIRHWNDIMRLKSAVVYTFVRDITRGCRFLWTAFVVLANMMSDAPMAPAQHRRSGRSGAWPPLWRQPRRRPCGKFVGFDRPSIGFHRPSIGVRSPLLSPLPSAFHRLRSPLLPSPPYPPPMEGPIGGCAGATPRASRSAEREKSATR